jgi:peptide deformylase
MAVRTILLYGDPRLEAPNRPVEAFDEALEALIEDLFETSWRTPGLGLAAPQVGVNLQLAVVDLSIGEDPDARIVLANPEIVASEGRASLEEGCLSFPGLFTTVVRPKWLRLRALDGQGRPFEREADGLLAQAICHETDHLEARLLVHHLRGLKRRMFLKRVAKMRDTGAWPSSARV